MVGVPRLVWCERRAVVADQLAVAAGGPAAGSRAGCRTAIRTSATDAATRIWLMRARAAGRRRASACATRSRPRRPGRLHQHDVSRAQLAARSSVERRVRVGHVRPTPHPTNPSRPRAEVQARARLARRRRAGRRPSRTASRPTASCSSARAGAELDASRRAPPRYARPPRPIARQRLQRGPHGVGVGVVGVVDDRHAVRRAR